MSPRPKRLPRLWCALQGLLPLEACLAAQRGELGWPAGMPEPQGHELPAASDRPPTDCVPPVIARTGDELAG